MKIRGRIIGALLVSGTVFGAVYGAAATLNVNGGTIQQGSDLSLVCQSTPIKVDSWGVNTSDDAVTGGKATFVQISGVDDATCAGNRLMGRVENGDGDVVGYVTTLNTDGGATTPPAVIEIAPFTGPAGPHIADGVYKLQFSTPDGAHGIEPDSAKGLRIWIEGPAGS
jgi:hypothetical protein